MCSPSIDIIVLTKDNSVELESTICSIPSESSFLLRVLIVDGGELLQPNLLALSSILSSEKIVLKYINSKSIGITGIYPSMNLALQYVESDWFIFMNSGDSFSRSFSFSSIRNFLLDSTLSVVFGQANIVDQKFNIHWFVPDSRITKIDKWLRYFEPNHQAMFLRSSLAVKYHFSGSSPIGADALWKRKILANESYKYVKCCFTDFFLGGVSTSYSLSILLTKLREPSRRPLEKCMEVVKYLLFRVGLMSSFLQKLKSTLISFFF